MFRLRVIPIRLPPLRERPEDILLIGEQIVAELNARGRRQVRGIAPAAQVALERYAWPGNVRELRNVLAYAFAIGDGATIELADLPSEVGAPGPPETTFVVAAEPSAPAADAVAPELRRIRDALARTGGNRERAARLLGMSRVTLWRRLRDLGLDE
jgi:DNA-binding NtrC family response regulator